jgi:signal peptidase II
MLKWLNRSYPYLVLFLGLVVIDQATKFLAFNGDFGSFLNMLRPYLGKQLFLNHYFAFSLPIIPLVSYLIYIVLLSGLLIWFVRLNEKSVSAKLAFVFILAGALSNIGERIVLGYVQDFIYVGWGNIFNLADVFIILGILLMLRES